jgi:FHA domain
MMRMTEMTRRVSAIGAAFFNRFERILNRPLGADAEPLEIRNAVVDNLETRVTPIGRGQRIFPYSRVLVRVVQTSSDRPSFEATFRDLETRLAERLRELRCAPVENLDLKIVFLKRSPPEWPANKLFSVECQNRGEGTSDREVPQPSRLRVTVVKGEANQTDYTFAEGTVLVGRTPDPVDQLGRVRRNNVVFLETTDGATETVGRAHARLSRDSVTREYRVYDEGSSNGTQVLRAGASIMVPPRDPRGVQVRSGDEIQLGHAIIRIAIEGSDGVRS